VFGSVLGRAIDRSGGAVTAGHRELARDLAAQCILLFTPLIETLTLGQTFDPQDKSLSVRNARGGTLDGQPDKVRSPNAMRSAASKASIAYGLHKISMSPTSVS
jgi:hypothetical protein